MTKLRVTNICIEEPAAGFIEKPSKWIRVDFNNERHITVRLPVGECTVEQVAEVLHRAIGLLHAEVTLASVGPTAVLCRRTHTHGNCACGLSGCAEWNVL